MAKKKIKKAVKKTAKKSASKTMIDYILSLRIMKPAAKMTKGKSVPAAKKSSKKSRSRQK